MKDRRSFNEVISSIKGCEKDKDKFLKAARLKRCESDNRLNASQKEELAFMGMTVLLVIAILWPFMWLMGR